MWTARITRFLSTRYGYTVICLRNDFLSWKQYFSHSRHGRVSLGHILQTILYLHKLDRRSVSLIFPNFCPVIIRLRPQSPRHFALKLSACLTKLTSLLSQSHACSSITSRRIQAPPPLSLQKHTDLRAYNFAHSPCLWHQPRLATTTCACSWSLCGINPVTPYRSLPIELFNHYLSTCYACHPTK
jgi:hypothetical protein